MVKKPIDIKRQDYLETGRGKALMMTYNTQQRGVWEVVGEGDENHSGRVLGHFRGRLNEVIDVAIRLPKFFTYGQGGTISRLVIQDIDSEAFKERDRLRREIADRQDRLTELEANLTKHGDEET